ncbi:MAG: DCC1-like thiol-disulfide oxidoreductase family protein [Terracidiphilus sp.]
MTQTPSAEGWILYDGDCAVCIRWMHFWDPILRRRGFVIDTLQADWAAKALGMPRDEILRDIRLLTASGASYAGADVYLFVAKKIWWTRPFAVLFSLPGFKSLLWAAYRWFAANRQCVSGRCVRKP